jgi:hypothetical protein
MLAALTSQATTQAAVFANLALDYGRALEWIEAEALFADRQQALRPRAASGIRRFHRTDPTALHPMPSQNLTGLKPFTQVPLATGQQYHAQQCRSACNYVCRGTTLAAQSRPLAVQPTSSLSYDHKAQCKGGSGERRVEARRIA